MVDVGTVMDVSVHVVVVPDVAVRESAVVEEPPMFVRSTVTDDMLRFVSVTVQVRVVVVVALLGTVVGENEQELMDGGGL